MTLSKNDSHRIVDFAESLNDALGRSTPYKLYDWGNGAAIVPIMDPKGSYLTTSMVVVIPKNLPMDPESVDMLQIEVWPYDTLPSAEDLAKAIEKVFEKRKVSVKRGEVIPRTFKNLNDIIKLATEESDV